MTARRDDRLVARVPSAAAAASAAARSAGAADRGSTVAVEAQRGEGLGIVLSYDDLDLALPLLRGAQPEDDLAHLVGHLSRK